MRTHVLKTLAVAFVVAAALAQAPSALAQDEGTDGPALAAQGKEVDAEVAGIVGLGFLGADLGVILPPMFGLYDHTWAYFVFPAVLAGAGVTAGVFVADDLPRAANISFIGVGMGLFVPAVVGSLAWKSSKEKAALQAERGLIQFGKVKLHPPSVASVPTYTAEERQRFGLPARTSTRVTLLSGTF